MTSVELLDAFRKDADDVKSLRKLVENPVFQRAMAVLKAAGPENYEPDTSTDGAANKHLGRILGYANYPNRLLYLATYPKDKTRVDETYAADN